MAFGQADLRGHFNRHSGRYGVIGFVSLFLLLLGISLLSTIFSPDKDSGKMLEWRPDRSIFNAKGTGYQAWYQTLKKTLDNLAAPKAVAKFPSVRIWRSSFEALTKLGAPHGPAVTMVILEPQYFIASKQSPLSASDVEALLRWVKQGNTLIFLDKLNRPHTLTLLAKLGLRQEQQKPPPIPKPVKIKSATGKALSVHSEQPVLFKSASKKHLVNELVSHIRKNTFVAPIYPGGTALSQYKGEFQDFVLKTVQTPVLLKAKIGKGELFLGSISDIAQNQYLNQEEWDNYQLFTNIVFTPGKPVYINEYVHGKQDINTGFWGYLYNRTPIGKIAVQLAVVFLFLLWWSFSNWRPRLIPPLEADASVSLGDFVTSLGGLYQKQHADVLVLKPCFDAVLSALERRCRIGMTPHMEQAELDHRLGRALLGTHGFLAYLGYTEAQAQGLVKTLNDVYGVLNAAAQSSAQIQTSTRDYSRQTFVNWVQDLSALRTRLKRQ